MACVAACGGGDTPAGDCGDGNLDTGEQCDDGNTANGDGCSNVCTNEGGPFCGDGTVDAGEDCDDGNNTSEDGCSASCDIEGGLCGDGFIDTGEQCDDGNNLSGDGCSAGCFIETVEACGNGIREGVEECDDGNTSNGDGCSATCTFEMTGAFCGNGVVEGGEQCDDGNTSGGDGCTAACQLEAGACGDGILNSGEQCDDGNVLNGDGCSSVCVLEGAVCGNSVVDAGEQCDDGNVVNGDGCSALCRTEACGDGVVQAGEQCDDGNLVNGDGCSAVCVLEVAPGCGNGILEAGEGCDDGNVASGDGCSATCTIESTGMCAPDWTLTCGGSDSWNTTSTGATDNVDLYSCVGWNESGPEYTYTFTATTASTITIALSGTTADLDLFVLSGGGGACNPANCVAHGDSSLSFFTNAGETYFVVVDGYMGASGPFSVSLGCGVCGDGAVDPGEQCDDGNIAGGDGCSAVCVFEGCGNGTLDTGEECDDGNSSSCDGCSAACVSEGCGNFLVECTETCDDGNVTAGDGCSATCQFEGGSCTDQFTLTCGGSDAYDTTLGGSADLIDTYACASWNESGREYAYSFTAPAAGSVTVTLTGTGTNDLDVFVLSNAGGVCSSSNCIAYGNTAATFMATGGTVYHVLVDGYNGAQGPYTIDVSCGGGVCGNGVLNAGEACDDGGTVSGDGCSSTRVVESCGDGIVQAGLGEQCDDGNITSGDGCSPTCTNEMGACVPDLTLGCPGTDTYNTTSPGSTDQINTYGCESWDESGPEYTYEYIAVDTGSVTATLSGMTTDLDVFVITAGPGGACVPSTGCLASGNTAATWSAVSGQRYYVVVDGFAGASGAYTLTMTCTGGSVCGDGVLDSGEQCDDGNTTGGDGCSAICTLEAGTCTPAYNLNCGSTDAYATTAVDATDRVNNYSCQTWDESGREYTYSFTPAVSGTATVTLTPQAGIDLDVFVLLDAGAGCVAGNCVASGDSSASWSAVGGTTYYVVVDGFGGAEGTYSISLTCP